MPNLILSSSNDNRGLDGIGYALALLIITRLIRYTIAMMFLIINPIRILIMSRDYLKTIKSKLIKIIIIFTILLPIAFSVFIVFEVPISNYKYILKYETGKDPYSVDATNYKTANDFKNELRKRGLLYDNNYIEIQSTLNKKYENQEGYYRFRGTRYDESTMMGTYDNYFYDTYSEEKIISSYSNTKAPVYIYNAILILPNKDGKLQYVSLERYDNELTTGNFVPVFRDYYIECKILYVDGNIYAMIGMGASYNIENYYMRCERQNKKWYDNNNPYNMILSEKDSITTYYDGKYYPNGAIGNDYLHFTMMPNTNTKEWSSNYPTRKVNILNVETINKIAEELQNDILKKSIEYHFANEL